MESPRIQFRALKPMSIELEKRTDSIPIATPAEVSTLLSETARRDLERYYEMLRMSLPTFSEGEAMLICDIMNGHINLPQTVNILWLMVQDAIREGYAEKWGVDGPELVERLRGLTKFECMAVADAVEQFWSGSYYKDASSTAIKIRQVGLVREER